jgi:hypothetical protein
MTGLVERVALELAGHDGALKHNPEFWRALAEDALRAILETHAIVDRKPTTQQIDELYKRLCAAGLNPADFDMHLGTIWEAIAATPDPLKN